MNGKRKPFLVALIVIAVMFPSHVRAEVDDLLSLYGHAGAYDPAIGKAKARLDAGKADTDISVSQMLPHIDANAGINWISNTSLYYGSSNISGSYTGDNYGFSVRVPLFSVPNVLNLAASQASARGADAALSGSRQDLIITLTEAYFGLLKAQIDEVLYRGELQRLGQIYDQAKEFKSSGTGTVTSDDVSGIGTVTSGDVSGTVTTGYVYGTVTTGYVSGTVTTGGVSGTVTTGGVSGTVTTGYVSGTGSIKTGDVSGTGLVKKGKKGAG